jgi:hypothetical protein
MSADVLIAIGIDPSEAKAGRDQIVRWNDDIAASYDKVLAASKAAGSQSAGADVAQKLTQAKQAAESAAQSQSRLNAVIAESVAEYEAQSRASALASQRTGSLKPAFDAAAMAGSQCASSVAQLNADLNGFSSISQTASAPVARLGAQAAAASGNFRNMRMVVGQAGYQISDLAIVSQMGGQAIGQMGIQVGQFLGVLGPMGVLAGAAVTVLGVMAGAMLRSSDSAKQAADSIKQYNSSLEAAVPIMERYRSSRDKLDGKSEFWRTERDAVIDLQSQIEQLTVKREQMVRDKNFFRTNLSFAPGADDFREVDLQLSTLRETLFQLQNTPPQTKGIDALTSVLTSEQSKIELLKKQRELREAISAANPKDADSLERLGRAQDAVNHAVGTFVTDGERAVLVAQAQSKAATMGEAAGARYLAQRQAEISLMGQAIPQSERANALRAASTQILAQWAAATNTNINNLEHETQAQSNLNATIGRGYEVRKQMEIQNAVDSAKRANPAMSASQEVDLRRNKSRELEAKRVGQEFSDLDALQDSAKYENMLADARLRGTDALHKANVEVETQKRLKQYSGNEADIRKAVNDNSLAQQRSELASRAASLSPSLQSKQEVQDLDLVIAKMRELGATAEEIAQVYQNAEIRKLEASQDWADGAKASLMRYSQSASNYGTMAGNAVSSGMRSMENALVSFSSKTMTAAQAFKSMASSIIQDLIRMQVQAQITGPLSKAISGGIGDMFGSGKQVYSSTDAVGPYMNEGPSFDALPARAAGGPVSAGQMYQVNEIGREMFIPNSDGYILNAGDTSAALSPKAANSNTGSSGGNVIQITNYVEAGASMGDVEAAVASGIRQAAPHIVNAAVQQSVPASVGAVQAAANRGGSFAQSVGRR